MFARRKRAVTMGQAEAQRLMNALMDFAQERLKERGGFAPLAGWLDRQGTPALEAAYVNAHELPAREIAVRLVECLRSRILAGEAQAAAMASDVQFGKRGSEEMREAVELHIEHENGYCVDIYVPYRVRKSRWSKTGAKWRVRWTHPVAQESARQFWTDSATDES